MYVGYELSYDIRCKVSLEYKEMTCWGMMPLPLPGVSRPFILPPSSFPCIVITFTFLSSLSLGVIWPSKHQEMR